MGIPGMTAFLQAARLLAVRIPVGLQTSIDEAEEFPKLP